MPSSRRCLRLTSAGSGERAIIASIVLRKAIAESFNHKFTTLANSDLFLRRMPTEKRPQALHIRRITTIPEWRALQSGWDAMLAESRSDAIFLTWDWIDVWLEVYGDGGWWFILVAENEDGRLLGAAPMMVVRGPRVPGKWIRRLTLIGQQADTASEYLDWIARRDCEQELATAFAQHLLTDMRAEWDLIELTFVRDDAIVLPALRAVFEKAGSPAPCVDFQTKSPYLPLPATWEEFAASRSSGFRNRLNKLHRDHEVRIRLGGVDMSVAEGMRLIRELHHKRWRGESSSFVSARYIRFHDLIAERLHALDRLLLVFLEIDGQIVAGRYDFGYGGKGWCFQGGWLPDWEKQSAGKMLVAEIIRVCIQKGLREYDFLGGDAKYKSDWTGLSRNMVRINEPNPGSLCGRIFTGLKKLVQRRRGTPPSGGGRLATDVDKPT